MDNSTSDSAVEPSSTLHNSHDEHRPPNKEHVRVSEANAEIRARRGTNSSGRFNLQRATTSLLQPIRPVGKAPGVLESLKSILLASWFNVLLVFLPISWALYFTLKGKQDIVIFVTSFLAIIPLAKLLAFATEELSMRVGQTLAGLLNATLGNAVELIVAIIALTQCKLRIVQASLVGSILSNLLLVLGMCFFAGGLKYQEQGFGHMTTQLNSSLLTISVIAVLLPAAFHFSVNDTETGGESDIKERKDILSVSHGVAVVLLFIYGAYLYFQLYSHANLYTDKGQNAVKSTRYAPRPKKAKKKGDDNEKENTDLPESKTTSRTNTTAGTTLVNSQDLENGKPDAEEEEEIPQLSLWMTIGLLVGVTVVIAVTAEFLVNSIEPVVSTGVISEEWIGVILLPIAGNAAEHLTAVTVSVKDKLTLSLGVAVGSSIQIALFVIPFIIVLAWILGKPLTLLFDPFESVSLFLSVLTVNYVVQDGKSNWLEGMILMCLYIILAVTFWFYHPVQDLSFLKC